MLDGKKRFVRGGKTLQEEIDFKLDVISTELTKVKLEGNLPSESEWDAFSAIFKDMVKFNKLMSFQGQVAKYGMKWAKSRLSGDQSVTTKQVSGTSHYETVKDPVHYWIGVLKNDKLGYDCSKRGDSFEAFFEECGRELKVGNVSAQVTHVLKSGSKCCSQDKRTFRISKKDGGGHWWGQHELWPGSKAEEEFLEAAETKLLIKGIVEEECKILYPATLFFITNVERRFCHEVNKMFFGDTVNEKRFCRYEIPSARGCIR